MNDAAEDLKEVLNIAGDAVRREADGTVRLVGSECGDCATRVYPPSDVCCECMAENMSPLAMGSAGTLYSYSVVHAAPKGWTLPFVAAYVDLPEGVRVFAHIVDVDPADLAMDMPVEATIAVLGSDEQGNPVESYAFRPAAGGDA
jgi:uncharacterized OB-fold protein